MSEGIALDAAIRKNLETLGRLRATGKDVLPRLGRSNRIRSVQSSCAIEGNPLSVEQVTAVPWTGCGPT